MPLVAGTSPERGMSDVVLGFPLPAGFRPKIAILVSATGDELEILPVGDRVPLLRKNRNVYDVGFGFVVPAESIDVGAGEPKSRTAGGNFNHPWRERWSRTIRFTRLPNLLIERQLMQHVGEGFRMHQPMFNGHVEQLAEAESVVRLRQGRYVESGVERFANAANVIAHGFHRWPVSRLIGRQSAIHRINAKGKQVVEIRMGRQIGRASCREREEREVVGGRLKKK